MQVNHGGFDAFMAKVVLDIRYRMPGRKHIDCTRMSKTVGWIDVFQSFFRQCLLEIFSADAVNTVTGQFIAALIDEEPVFE